MYVAGVGSILCISAPSAHKRARAKAKEAEQKGRERERKKSKISLPGNVVRSCFLYRVLAHSLFYFPFPLYPAAGETSILYDCPNGIVGSSSTNKCIKLFVPTDSTDLSSLSVNLPDTGMHGMISSFGIQHILLFIRFGPVCARNSEGFCSTE